MIFCHNKLLFAKKNIYKNQLSVAKPHWALQVFHFSVRGYPRGCSARNHAVCACGTGNACNMRIGIFHVHGEHGGLAARAENADAEAVESLV